VQNAIFPFFRYHFLCREKKRFYKSLRSILGFMPNHLGYYETAFIHKSASVVYEAGRVINNERLEFLGDAVLDAVIGDFLYHKFPTADEGFLTQMRSKIVNGEKLNEFARRMQLDLLLVTNLEQHHQGNRKLLEDTFEALIGAIYMDKGYIFTKKFVLDKVLKCFVDMKQLQSENNNYKSLIIEWAQKFKKETNFVTNSDSQNLRYFIAQLYIDKKVCGTGTSTSKKEAEQRAAKDAIERLNIE